MAARIAEQRLGPLRWIVASGPARDAFGALGEHMRAEIREVTGEFPGLEPLRRHTASERGEMLLAAVREASETRYPEIWAELVAMAAGSGVGLDDLALLNFRGDVGVAEATPADGIGCSDLAWRRQTSFLAHNEDDSAFFDGRCVLLTLALDDLPPVTSFWKPGFVPSNTISVTGDGLVCAIDHLPVAAPRPGAGRQIVARGLQRAARTIDQAVAYLRDHPSAGGFAYLIGDRDGRAVIVESAGQYAWREVGTTGPLEWHTNHGRYITSADAAPGGSSEVRGRVLAALEVPAAEPDAAWFMAVLAGAAPPAGVRAEPTGGMSSATLCTFVADLTDGEMTMLCRAAPAALVISITDLASGRAPVSR